MAEPTIDLYNLISKHFPYRPRKFLPTAAAAKEYHARRHALAVELLASIRIIPPDEGGAQ